jgi:hypothetical protein
VVVVEEEKDRSGVTKNLKKESEALFSSKNLEDAKQNIKDELSAAREEFQKSKPDVKFELTPVTKEYNDSIALKKIQQEEKNMKTKASSGRDSVRLADEIAAKESWSKEEEMKRRRVLSRRVFLYHHTGKKLSLESKELRDERRMQEQGIFFHPPFSLFFPPFISLQAVTGS